VCGQHIFFLEGTMRVARRSSLSRFLFVVLTAAAGVVIGSPQAPA
jgi:hypothetical protein